MDLKELSEKFDAICRICLKDCYLNDKTKSLFSELDTLEMIDEEIFFVYEIICAAGSLQVRKNDGYPTLICSTCFHDAETAYKFKLQCQKSAAILKECLELKKNTNSCKDGSFDAESNVDDATEIDAPAVSEKSKTGNMWSAKNARKSIKDFCETTLKDNLKLDSELLNVCEFETEECVFNENVSNDNSSEIPKIKDVKVDSEDEEIPKKCFKCNHVFKSITAYDKHACEIAKTEGRKICPVCGKNLSHSYIKSHLRTHTTQRSYVCNLCGKLYNSSCSLKFHMFKHSGEKPYLCSLCGKSFIQPTSLKYHMRFHNNERRYSCNYCEKTFVIQSHKVAHERTHTGTKPFTCEICGKSFTRKVELNSHQQRHENNLPFSCRYCGKRFIKRTHLNLHEMIHSGKRPHQCQFCGKGFIQRSPMLQHIRTHHPEQEEKND